MIKIEDFEFQIKNYDKNQNFEIKGQNARKKNPKLKDKKLKLWLNEMEMMRYKVKIYD